MNKNEQISSISTADNGVVPTNGLNYLEVTARIYADEQGAFPDSDKAAATVVGALGELVGATQSIMVDTQPVSMQETPQGWIKSPWPGFGLTPRRIELASGIARGLSNGAIGKELFVSEATVKGFVSDVLIATEAEKRSAIPSKLWRILVPDLLDHSRIPQGRTLKHIPAKP